MLFVRFTKFLDITLPVTIQKRMAVLNAKNATIRQGLRMYVNKDQKNWHLLLPTVLIAMRSTPNTETLGFTPFKMLFRSEMRLPFDTTLVPRETPGPEAKVHIDQLLDRLKTVHGHATRNTEIT